MISKGGEHSVATSVGYKREYLNGNVSIHNHPNDGTFSPSDLRDFGYGASAIYAATPTGTYKLENVKVGTKKQYDGWKAMQDDLESQPFHTNGSPLERSKQAQKNMQSSKEYKQMNALAEKWVKMRQSGASQKDQDAIYDKYKILESQYKSKVAKETRRLEVQPYHDFYKKNAAKYGFKYSFIKR